MTAFKARLISSNIPHIQDRFFLHRGSIDLHMYTRIGILHVLFEWEGGAVYLNKANISLYISINSICLLHCNPMIDLVGSCFS